MNENNCPWPALPLRKIAAEMCLGKMLDKEKNRGTLQPYLRNVNVRWLSFDLSDLKEMRFEDGEETRFGLEPGDLVICEGGEPGRAAVWKGQSEKARIQKALHRVRFRPDEYDPSFAMYYIFFGTLTNRFAEHYTGSTIKHLTGKALSQVQFPVPPFNEQRRIVAKIEELFSDLDAGVAALERAKAKLKRYRAAVLKAAVEGKLTEEWRQRSRRRTDIPVRHSLTDKNVCPPDCSDRQECLSSCVESSTGTETASQLLERILKERRRKWEEDQLAVYAKAGKKLPANWKDKYKEPAAPDETGLPALPEGWCWATMEQVGKVQLGRQRSPQHHVGPHMRPYLRVANVFEDRIDVTDVMQMNFTPAEYEVYRLQHGDILLNEGQSMELVGRPAIYRDEVPGACFTNTLVRFQCLGKLDPEYALAVFLTYLKNGRFQKIATITVNIAHLGAGRFCELEFPLPPLDEQKQIVAEVKRHSSIIQMIEFQVKANLKRSSRLRQSILKRAFEGKLVPQDPNDEPASALLQRVRAKGSGDACRNGISKKNRQTR
jgi:type I restriction enzyme, S subunit